MKTFHRLVLNVRCRFETTVARIRLAALMVVARMMGIHLGNADCPQGFGHLVGTICPPNGRIQTAVYVCRDDVLDLYFPAPKRPARVVAGPLRPFTDKALFYGLRLVETVRWIHDAKRRLAFLKPLPSPDNWDPLADTVPQS